MDNAENTLLNSAHDTDSIARARNLLSLAEKALKSIMVYPEKNPVIREQKERLNREFQSYLDTYETLAIRINESAITLDNQTIYEGKTKGRGLAFLLYRDGVREITFYEGLTQEELNDFLEALAENWQVTEDTDVVSSFWEKDFHHIAFSAINELFTDMAEPGGNPEGFSSQFYNLTDSDSPGKIFMQEEDSQQTSGLPQWVEKVVDKPRDVSSFILLDGEDLSEIKEILEEDRKNFNPKREFIYTLLDLLILEDNPEEYAALLTTLKEYFSNLISNANFDMTCNILSTLSQISDIPTLQPSKQKNLEKTILGVVQDQESIEKIRQMIQNNTINSWDDLLQYTSYLGEKAIPVLIDILMQKKAQAIHTKVQSLLLKFGRNNIEILGACLSDDRSQLVNQIIPILSKVKEKAIPYLKLSLHHPDAEVRRKTVRALSQIGGNEVNSLLSELLSDPDPTIRILTAKCIDNPDVKTADVVCGLIQQKEFMKKDILERKALVGILQKTDSENAVVTLRGLLYHKSWLKRGEINRFKSFVAHILADIGTDSAIKTLEEGIRTKNRVVRNACQDALSKIEGKLHKEVKENL
jgi:hypothetical protein